MNMNNNTLEKNMKKKTIEKFGVTGVTLIVPVIIYGILLYFGIKHMSKCKDNLKLKFFHWLYVLIPGLNGIYVPFVHMFPALCK